MNTTVIRKIFEIERRNGYVNAAVIGGLDGFLEGWVDSEAGSIPNPKALARFRKMFSPGYNTQSREQRKKWIEDATVFLDEKLAAVAAPPVDTQPETSFVQPRGKRKVAAKPSAPVVEQVMESPVSNIKGINTALTAKFMKLGVKSVRDLLYYFPHRHLDYSQRKTISALVPGEEQTVIATVWQAQETRPGGRRSTEAVVGDETGNMRVIWFNQPYLARTLTTNARIVLSGKVNVFKGQPVFQSPEWEPLDGHDTIHTARLVPVYPLTRGLYPRQVRRLMKQFVGEWAPRLTDFLPEEIRERLGYPLLEEAIEQAHFPDNQKKLEMARQRLAFDELFLLQLGVMNKKRAWQETKPGNPMDVHVPVLASFMDSLPYTLTGAQDRVLREVLADLSRPVPMSRLLQGEVGSGKTIVATASLLTAVANGFQSAFMAPTEILAEQHFQTICGLLADTGRESGDGYMRSFTGILQKPLTVALLIGDIRQAGKKKIREAIENGSVDIAIGTHALLQKDVAFDKLGLAIVDEQHRFGVEQRAALRDKGFNPHILVMTATPIPRTLALTLYGDLDISVIDELPPGRQTIKTKWLKPNQRQSAHAFIRKQVGEGRQAFIICPLVEESESVQAQAAVAEYERLSADVFPDLRLGLLHGRMSSKDKDAIMERFRKHELDILVSTPVIEVGIDIPNATVMLIESADRFGLSQLHQFRGRVGRGEHQSYCMLQAENPSEVGRARLDIIEHTEDGFKLAEEDLKLRGPGEFLGTRQSGLPDLRMAKISDIALLEKARVEATRIFESDINLNDDARQKLAAEMNRVWREAGEWS